MRTVVGMYDDLMEAQRAAAALKDAGFAANAVDIVGDDEGDEVTLKGLRQRVPDPDASFYIEGVRHGDFLVIADTDDNRAQEAASILGRFRIINADHRAQELRSTTSANVAMRDFDANQDYVLPVIEEQLEVGKREVERGRMRIYNRITETAVERQVGLRDETIRVNRRSVSRPLTATDRDAFTERSFEMVETDEEAVVSKTANVVEEVVISKDIAERTETIRDTLRRSDVEVEEIKGVQSFDSYSNDFRSYYDTTLKARGGNYDQYAPVFRYGYTLGTTDGYRNKDWNAIEGDARRMWEEKNPGTWDQFKDTIHYTWSKITGRS